MPDRGQLVAFAAYGPLHRFVPPYHAPIGTDRQYQALDEYAYHEWVAGTLGDERTVDFLIQRRMYIYFLMGQYEQALGIGERLLARHRAAGNRTGEAKTLADLAELYVSTGRSVEGMRYLARAGLILERTRRTDRYLSALCSYGDAATSAGLYELAAAFYEDYYAGNGPDENAYIEVVYTELLVSWGLWLHHLGQSMEAGQRLRRAEAVAAAWLARYGGPGERDNVQVLTGVRALVLAKLGEPDRAIELAESAIDAHAVHARPRYGGWMPHLALGVALRQRGDHAGARRELTAARTAVRALVARVNLDLLIQLELAELAADVLGPQACTDLVEAVREQTRQLWHQRRQRLAMLREARQREELDAQQARTAAALLRDPLTGLGNRRRFDQMITALEAGDPTAPVSLLLIDVDKFKAINDAYSHSIGDQVLREVATIIDNHCRAGVDIPVRYAGDEFTVFLRTDLAGAVEIAERIRTAVAVADFDAIAPGVPVSISAGVAAARRGTGARHLFHIADARLYDAKRSGRNRVCA